ncbi:MAG: hypothetical protein LBL33_10545 [Tannerella sp.]|nr:hypothetical protein [Tannerella sp.]
MILGESKSVLRESKSALKESKSTLKESKSVLGESKSVLKESKSTLGESKIETKLWKLRLHIQRLTYSLPIVFLPAGKTKKRSMPLKIVTDRTGQDAEFPEGI